MGAFAVRRMGIQRGTFRGVTVWVDDRGDLQATSKMTRLDNDHIRVECQWI